MLDEARPTLRDAIGNTLIYRKLTYLKSQPLLNWLLVGTLALLVSSLIGRASGELLHPWLYVYVCYAIFAGIPYYSIHALDLFSEAESALQFTFCLNADELHSRLLDEARSTFGYRSIGMWVGGGLVLALGDVTIIALRNHIKHAISYRAILFSGQAIFFLCGHGAYVVLKLMQVQYRLVRLPLKLTFLKSGNRAVDAITQLPNFTSFTVLAAYVGLLLAVSLSPFRTEPIMSVWLLVLAASPILTYSWSLIQTHVLQTRIKYFHLDSINAQVEQVYQEARANSSKDNLERLSKLVDIQRNIEQTSEWPISPQVIATLIITSAAAISQFLGAWSALVKTKP